MAYSDDEKTELIKNLQFEVAHRAVQFRRELEDRLENFTLNQETLLSHIPKGVRQMTMREFGEKYNGNIQAAVRGLHRAKFVSERGESALEKIDKDTRKRKWVESQETEDEASSDQSRATKNARVMQHAAKPGSSTGPGTAQRARILASERTPNKSRTYGQLSGSPSPAKMRPQFNGNTSSFRPPHRPLSPTKSSALAGGNSRANVPTLSSFNPSLPPKHPTLRLPRKDENMLSVNGTPLANPLTQGRLFATTATSNTIPFPQNEQHMLKRTKSTINVKRDPSFAFHSRTDSQSSTLSSQPSFGHMRTNSLFSISSTDDSTLSSQTLESPNTPTPSQSQPTRPGLGFGNSMTRSYSVTISTTDGHLLEFDPLQTSPRALEELEGVTESAKKQARQEMGRLMLAAVEKWKI